MDESSPSTNPPCYYTMIGTPPSRSYQWLYKGASIVCSQPYTAKHLRKVEQVKLRQLITFSAFNFRVKALHVQHISIIWASASPRGVAVVRSGHVTCRPERQPRGGLLEALPMMQRVKVRASFHRCIGEETRKRGEREAQVTRAGRRRARSAGDTRGKERSFPRVSLALRARLTFASLRLKYAKNHACSAGYLY